MKKVLIAVALLFTLSANAQQTTCKATKKDSTQCKSTMVLKSGYCKAHDPSTPKCGAKTSAGKACNMAVTKTGDRCRHHQGKEALK